MAGGVFLPRKKTALMLRLFFLLLLSLPALARPPAEVVDEVYKAHLDLQDQRKVIQAHSRCFTPGFMAIIQRAFKGQPPKAFVDVDFLVNNQMGFGAYELGSSQVSGKDAKVSLTIWPSRGQKFGDPAMKKKFPAYKALVHLTDVGDGEGFQIKDLEFLPTPDFAQSFRVRDYLKKIADEQ